MAELSWQQWQKETGRAETAADAVAEIRGHRSAAKLNGLVEVAR